MPADAKEAEKEHATERRSLDPRRVLPVAAALLASAFVVYVSIVRRGGAPGAAPATTASTFSPYSHARGQVSLPPGQAQIQLVPGRLTLGGLLRLVSGPPYELGGAPFYERFMTNPQLRQAWEEFLLRRDPVEFQRKLQQGQLKELLDELATSGDFRERLATLYRESAAQAPRETEPPPDHSLTSIQTGPARDDPRAAIARPRGVVPLRAPPNAAGKGAFGAEALREPQPGDPTAVAIQGDPQAEEEAGNSVRIGVTDPTLPPNIETNVHRRKPSKLKPPPEPAKPPIAPPPVCGGNPPSCPGTAHVECVGGYWTCIFS